MRVLGLDLSTKPGFAVIDDGTGLITSGTMFELQHKLENETSDYQLLDRSIAVAVAVTKLAVEYQPDLIVIEQSNQGAGLVAMKSQEFIHCTTLLELRKQGFEKKVEYIYGATWQSQCGLKMTKEQKLHNAAVKSGTARGKIKKKHLTVQWANATFGLKLLMKDEDRADAIGIAYGGWKRNTSQAKQSPISIDKAFGLSED